MHSEILKLAFKIVNANYPEFFATRPLLLFDQLVAEHMSQIRLFVNQFGAKDLFNIKLQGGGLTYLIL
jgi:hypothetical protein